MAEGVAFGIAEKIITDLGSLALEEIGFTVGFKKELKKLENTAITIKAVLSHAEELQLNNLQVRTWLTRVKDASYEADDIITDFATHALKKKLVSNFFSLSNSILFRYKMAQRIKEVRGNFNDIIADKSFHLLDNRVENYTRVYDDNVEREHTHSYVVESKIFGRDVDKENVVELLLDLNPQDNPSVIPIQGMGGLGKTTLAQLLYNDSRIKVAFKQKMWVCVSQDFGVKRITEKIIKSITKKECPNLEMDQLQACLREQLEGKRYLLVLDDVWNENAEKWEKLKDLLIGGARGSKIMVTTRSEKVASIMRTVSTYHLSGLTDDDCWKLFKHRAFETGQEQEHQKLAEIGKDIVRKCGGVPLAAKALGSLMHSKTEEHEWVRVKENDVWGLSQEITGILPALMLSYNHLPFYLRQCFAYCSIYPKGYRIGKEDLILSWIAQGFVHSSGRSQFLEDIGCEYVKELMWGSFFQEPQVDCFGNLVSFTVHDLVHNVAQFVAGTECFIVEGETKNDIPEGVRHLSITEDNLSIGLLSSFSEKSNLRSLYLNTKVFIGGILPRFRCLRALSLQLESCNVPTSIGKLKHLRYLEICSESIVVIPNSFCKLQSLETLRLYCSKLRELPRDIRKMTKLRHIDLDESSSLTHMPSGLGHLTSLRTLPLFVPGKKIGCKLNELHALIHIAGRLTIQNLENVNNFRDSAKANLKGKENLQILKLFWNEMGDQEVDREEIAFHVLGNLEPSQNIKRLKINGYGNQRLPRWMMQPLLPNLMKVTLSGCRKCQHLPPFGQLPSLKVLKLEKMDALQFIEGSLVGRSRECFSSLERVFLRSIPNLENWIQIKEEEKSLLSLPRLAQLVVWDCPKLTSMPLLPSLEELNVGKCRERLIHSLLKVITWDSTISLCSYSLANLKHLKIGECDDLVCWPEVGLQGLTSLESLMIAFCPRMTNLPEEGLRGMTSLQRLTILDCESLNSLSGMRYLTALQDLSLVRCKEVHILDDMDDLASLDTLHIETIPKLVSLPEGLRNATSMQTIAVVDCEDLMVLPDCLGNFTSLQQLQVSRCPKLEAFPNEMSYPTTLQHLVISCCEGLKIWPNGLGNLKSLQGLGISCSSSLPSLPEEMQHLSTLRTLSLGGCKGFTTLPDWLINFTSLQQLEIYDFPDLKCLPEWMQSFPALQELYIFQCGHLTSRCRKEKGEDWPKIAGVPKIELDQNRIQ
ncbi:hypothetical protein AQUCO_02300192v1 [Aquilegia coerulea]|uniref:Uncharacterized protein n=1 Tax=Aquilegia coerulea TaxID=218851 RepID=A0A2G5DCF5_AQUCA|nr:hypothetical protein AQUCO_02300192v1 [Aquilegia coerulea]